MRVPAWVLPLAILLTVGAWQWADVVSSLDAARRPPAAAAGPRGETAPVSSPAERPRLRLPGAAPGTADPRDVAHGERGGKEHGPVPDRYRTMPNAEPALPEIIARGQLAYQTYCWICHGRSGQGNGPAAPGLDPRPYDLTGGEVQKEPDGYLFYRISEGVKETPMPAWKHTLDERTRWAIVHYLRTLAPERAAPGRQGR